MAAKAVSYAAGSETIVFLKSMERLRTFEMLLKLEDDEPQPLQFQFLRVSAI
jgi:hypothetical protein